MSDFLEMMKSAEASASGEPAEPAKETATTLDGREQALVDGRKKEFGFNSDFAKMFAESEANDAVVARRNQRAYAEKASLTDPDTYVATTRMLLGTGNRSDQLEAYRKLTPKQREEALRLAPGIAQQFGDDRGGMASRTIDAVNRGVSGVAQPIMELTGLGGTQEEIDYLRKLNSASQEFAPARPDDPWYQQGALQAAEMTPGMVMMGQGGVLGGAVGKVAGTAIGRAAAAGVPGAKTAFQAAGAVGKVPTAVGLKGVTTKGVFEGIGSAAGVTAASWAPQYVQEVDSLKELGMKDGVVLRALAGTTAAAVGLIESIVPNPWKVGNVSFKQGAIKAARQYLWQAAKNLPGEITEEGLQGVASGVGEHVAQYLDKDAKKKSIGEAFSKGWQQASDSVLPLVFMLGAPGIAGATSAAIRARREQLEQLRSKGFVSKEDAKKAGIEVGTRKEMAASFDAEIEDLKSRELVATSNESNAAAESAQIGAEQTGLPAEVVAKGQQEVAGIPPPLPTQQQGEVSPPVPPQQQGDVVPPPMPSQQQGKVPSPLPPQQQGSVPAIPVAEEAPAPVGEPPVAGVADTGSVDAIGERTKIMDTPVVRAKSVTDEDNVRYELFEAEDAGGGIIRSTDMDSGQVVSMTRYPSIDKAQKEFGRYEKTATPSPAPLPQQQVDQPELQSANFDAYTDAAWKATGKEGPVSENYKASQKQFVGSAADYGIQQGRVIAFDKKDGSSELQLAAIADELNQRGYEAGPVKKSRSDGVDNIEFSVTKKATVATPSDTTSAGMKSPDQQPVPSPVAEKGVAAPQTDVTPPSKFASWTVQQGSDGKLYRVDPKAKTKYEKAKTRQPVDPAEVVVATQDQFGNPIDRKLIGVRQEFAKNAKAGAEFTWSSYPTAKFKVQSNGDILDITTGRRMGTVQSTSNNAALKANSIKWTSLPAPAAQPAIAAPQEVLQDSFNPETTQQPPIRKELNASTIRSPQEEVRQEEGGADLRGSGQEQVRSKRESQEPSAQAEVQVKNTVDVVRQEPPVEAPISQEVSSAVEEPSTAKPKSEPSKVEAGKASAKTPKSPAKQVTPRGYLEGRSDRQLKSLAKSLGVKAANRKDAIDAILENPSVVDSLNSILQKEKPSKPRKEKPVPAKDTAKGKEPIPVKMRSSDGTTRELLPSELTAAEEKQKSILEKMGVTLRLIEGGNFKTPGTFNPRSMTIWLDRSYTEYWDSLWEEQSRPSESMTWGLFLHEMFHAIKRIDPKAWNGLHDWISKNPNEKELLEKAEKDYVSDLLSSLKNRLLEDAKKSGKKADIKGRLFAADHVRSAIEAAQAAGVTISDGTRFAADYTIKVLSDEDLRNEEGLSRYLEEKAGDFNFWDELGRDKPTLLAKIGRWVRKALRFAEPDTLAGQVRLAIESAMKENNIAPRSDQGQRASVGRSEFSPDNIKIEEVRAKDRPGKRVSKGLSAKKVKGKDVFEETEDLSLEYVKKKAPQVFIKNSNIIAAYPIVAGKKAFKKVISVEQAQEVYDVFVRESADNLNYILSEYKPELKNLSTLWYDGANAIANELAGRFKVSPEQAAGIIAAMSPQKDWYQNVRISELLLDAFEVNPSMTQDMVNYQKEVVRVAGINIVEAKVRKEEKAYKKSRTKKNKTALDTSKSDLSKAIIKADKVISMLEGYIGSKLSDVPQDVQPYMVRLYHEINTTKDYNVIAPDGSVIDVARNADGSKSRVAWGSFSEIGKAVSIRNDGSPENITRSLGVMHKIRNFYNNIIDPMSVDGDVTMDTHAIAAALLMPLSGASPQVSQNFGSGGVANSGPFGIKGLYYAFAEAYNLSAKENSLLPRQVQSATWDPVRGLFTDVFKSDKKNVAKIDGIWKGYQNGEFTIDETRRRVFEAAGGINDPTWARPVYSEPGEGVREEGVRKRGKRNGRDPVGSAAGSERAAVGRRSESTGDRDGRGRSSGGRYSPLEGAPIKQGATGPDPRLVDVAEQYARDNGIDLKRQAEYVQVDEARAKRIAQAYEDMPHAPDDPAVKEAYADLIRQTKAQYDALVEAGYTFTFYDGAADPYDGNPVAAMRDLRQNKTMAVYGTYDGYGTEGITKGAVDDNPMLADTGLKWNDQNGVERPVTANDLFRAVHDSFGHGLEGASFRARGEENAWQAHVRLFTGPAVGAITSETRGQNSWLNYGPYAEKNRTAKVLDTVFADQKTGLMPEWTWTEGRAADMEEMGDEGVRYSPGRQGKRKRDPEVTKAAQDLKAGLIDRDQYQRIVDMRMPLRKFDEVPIPASKKDMLRGLGDRKAGERLKRDLIQNSEDIAKGRLLETRLDIPAYDEENVWVVSLHEPRPDLNKGSAGRVVAYTPTSVLRNVTFGVTENAALNIAAGKPKSTIATMRGEYVPMTSQQAYKLAETNKDRWVEIGMNPVRHTYFYDKDTQTPVVSAEEVVQVGGMVLAKNPVLGRRDDYRYSSGRNNDAKYLAAVDQGDMAKAQRMVDAAAAGAGEFAGGVSPVLYHGSPHSNFYEFQIPSKGFNSTVFGSYEVSRNAAFFTTDEEAASRYREQGGRKGGSVRKFRVFGELLDWRNGITDAQFNTLVSKGVNSRWLDRKGASWELFDKEEDPDGTLVKAIQKMGYDGVIIKDTDGTSDFDAYVAFTPSQIKSSDAVTYDDSGNVVPLSKRFDETLPDVRYSPRRKPKDDILAALYKQLEEKGVIKPQVAGDRTTSIKNRKTDELRAESGLPPRVRPARESFEMWEEEARRRYPTAKDRLQLVAEVEKDPEQLGKIESAAIGQHIAYLDNQRRAGKDVFDELRRTIKAANIGGTEAGRALVSRKAERFSDYSLAGLVNEHFSVVGSDPTDAQMQEYSELANRIEKLEKDKVDLAKKLAKETIARKKAEADLPPKQNPPQEKIGTKRATLLKKVADGFAAFQNAWGGKGSDRAAVGRQDPMEGIYGFGFGSEDLPNPSSVSRNEWLRAYMPLMMKGLPDSNISDKDMEVLGSAFGDENPFSPGSKLMKMLDTWATQSGLQEINWGDGVRVLFEDRTKSTSMMLEQISKESGVGFNRDAFSDPADYKSLAKAFAKYLPKYVANNPDMGSDVKNLLETSKALLDPLEYAINVWEDSQQASTFDRAAVGRQTETSAFKKWFGDSKVVGDDGDPLVVYHGSPNANINNFKTWGWGESNAAFFSSDPDEAKHSRGKQNAVYPVYLSLKNPLILNAQDKKSVLGEVDQENELIGQSAADGYDGIIWKDALNDITTYAVFEPTQIKSATGNRGTFDPSNPDIRYSPGRQEPDIKSAAASLVATLREAGVSSMLELESQVNANMPDVTPEQMQVIRDAWEDSNKKDKVTSPIGANPQRADIAARAKELMRSAIELGYGAEKENWMDVVDVVHDQLSLEVPGIDKYDTMQAISDYGVWRELPPEQVEVIIRAVRGKARQSLKIEDALKAISQSNAWLKSGVSPEEVATRLRDQGLLPKATGQERATPDSIERDLIAEFNKLKKTLPVPAESREGQLKSALTTAKTAASNRLEMLDKDIASLQEAVDNRKELAKPVAEKSRLEPDAELASLRSQLEEKRRQRDELKAQYEKIFPDTSPKKGRKQLTDEQKIEASVKLLRRQIDAVKADVQSLIDGTWVAAGKSAELTSERKEELKSELASLRASQKQARQASPAYQAREEAKYWERYRKSQEKRLAFWMKRRDEAQAGRLPVPLQKRTITEKSIIQKNMEIEEAQYEAMIAIEKANRATWNAGQWIGQGVLEATSLIPKTLMLGMEMSFVLRQGFFYTYSQPMKAFSALVESMPAVFSQRLALASMENIESRANAQEYHLAGVDFTSATGPKAKLEEMYQSSIMQWLERTETKLLLPLRTWAKAYAMFERGNRTFSNIMKADMYDIQKRDTLAAREFFGTNTDWTDNDIKQVGRTVNIFSGRGTGLKGGNPWLDWLFLARRWTWSRIQADFIVPFQLATPQWIGQWNADRGMRVALAKLYIQAMVGHAAKMAAAYFAYSVLAGDDEEEKPTMEFDLRSSDALALKIGETRFKDEGGLMPAVVLAARLLTGEIKTGKGEIKSIYGADVDYGGKTAADFVINYGRYKLGTAPSAILEWISGRDAVGNVMTKTDIVKSRLTPLTWREIYAAESELGLKRGTLAALEAFFGVSVSTHGDETKYKKANETDRLKQFETDLKRMEWDSPDPPYKDLLTTDQMEKVKSQRDHKKQTVVYEAFVNPVRKNYKSDDSYKEAVEKRDKFLVEFKKSGLSYEESRKLLIDYWKRNYGSPYETKNGVSTLKEGITNRLRQLRKTLSGN
jgi:hypothetical protein